MRFSPVTARAARSGRCRANPAPSTLPASRYGTLPSQGGQIGVGERTLRRWAADFGALGEVGLVDGRRDRRSDPLAGVDLRWLTTCREIIAEHTDASTPTKAMILERVQARLAATHGEGAVPTPGRTKAYEVLTELARGRNTFTGSAKGRRSIARRPASSYSRLVATRPGEFLLLDTTPLDVFAMEPVTLRWAATELTVALDLFSRCIAGVRLTPCSTKAADASGVIYDALRAKTCDPMWGPEARWPYLGVPTAIVVDADRLAEGHLAGMPVLAPETLIVDHGKVYMSTLVKAVCARLGISIQPARPLTPTDKATVERFFRTVREDLLTALPGYKGPDVFSRGVDVESGAFFFVDELDRIVREWIASVYHRRPHDGLTVPELPGVPMSPNDMYCYGVQRSGFVQIPARPDLCFDFLPVEWRQIHHYGIELGGLRYNSPALNAYRQVTSPYGGVHKGHWPFRVDAADVSRVWFQDPSDHRWHPITWEHAGSVGAPFSKEALVFAKQLAAQRDRFPDCDGRCESCSSGGMPGWRRDRGNVERRCAWPRSVLGLLGPRVGEPQIVGPHADALGLATAPGLAAHRTPPPDNRWSDDGSMDGGDDELDDESDGDFYADAMGVVE